MTAEMIHVTEYGGGGRIGEYHMTRCPDAGTWVAVRHGVIVGSGPTRAAAAAAGKVSRCEVRPATWEERRLLPRLRWRRLPAGTEAELLEVIHTDISRVLAAVGDDDVDYDYIHAPVLLEYKDIDIQALALACDDAALKALEDRREAVQDELDELRALAGQHDLFAGAPA